LDSKTSLEVMALFQQLGRDGITVVLVTHEPDIAEFAARVIVMRDGRVQSDTRHQPRDAAQAARELPNPDDEPAAPKATA
jgi:putative ABC transport system ATP-binding protein